MKGYLATTDHDWFTFLAGRPPLDEVNFWLRADIHRLFDKGYVTVTPDHRFVVSERLAKEWENGKIYYASSGKPIALPRARADAPDPGLLRWHNENVFEKGIAA